MGITNHSCVVVGRAFSFTKKSCHYTPISASTERQAVVTCTPWPYAGRSSCLIHHIQLLEFHQMKAKEISWNFPVIHAEGVKILSNRPGQYLSEIALQCVDVQASWVPLRRIS
jgi:hypothetical protein